MRWQGMPAKRRRKHGQAAAGVAAAAAASRHLHRSKKVTLLVLQARLLACGAMPLGASQAKQFRQSR